LDHKAALAQLAHELSTYQPPPFEIRPDPQGGWEFTATGKRIRVRDDSSRRILVFGGSSVVLPVYERAFPALLEKKLNTGEGKAVQVLNLGEPGYDSGAVLERLRVALPILKPDLVILYMGHNDYTAAYRKPIAADYDVFRSGGPLTALAWLAFLTSDYRARFLPGQLNGSAFGPYLDSVAEPTALLWLQRLGLAHVPAWPFARVAELALARFQKNMNTIIELAQGQGTFVLILTPISNLEAPVYGANPELHSEQQAAFTIRDYKARIGQLVRLKDQDVFSLDIRAKTPLLEWLRQLHSPKVRVLDLENRLRKSEFPYDFSGFSDYVHFTQPTHERVADLLASDLAAVDWRTVSEEITDL
jgi:lysophospholipase L1-like esterase